MDYYEQIEAIEKEIRETPYHKGTEHHIGMLRARLSRIREKIIEHESKRVGGGGGGGYAVKKQGDATVILIGPPSAGKSTLLNLLTNAQSKVAPYAFTTVSVIPGMMYFNDAKIQILDVPGLIEGAEEGKGRGKEVLSVARGADLIILLTDIKRMDAIERIKYSLERNGIRLNKNKPNVKIEKKHKGGIIVHTNFKQDFSKLTVSEIANELGLKNAEVTINEKLTQDQLIDSFSVSRVYTPCIFVVNKSDELVNPEGNNNLSEEFLYISAEQNINIEKLKNIIWDKLNFIKIYLQSDEGINFSHPLIVKKNNTLKDILEVLGEKFSENKKGAKIWGTGSKFNGQEVSLSAKAQDGMQIRFV